MDTTRDDTSEEGFVHSFDTSAADGPGVRFSLFLSGCPFRCLYCHNPDTFRLNSGRPTQVRAVLGEISKYAEFLRWAGGVTITGGDPLMQPRFVGAIVREVKRRFGLHVVLETQGYLASKVDDAWFQDIDLVMLDIKHIDPERHLELTGKPLRPTLETARRLVRLGKRLWIRYVLVPALSDDESDVARLADYVKSLDAEAPGLVERVEVLPFHKFGEHKWRELGLRYELYDTEPPPTVRAEEVRDQFRTRGILAC